MVSVKVKYVEAYRDRHGKQRLYFRRTRQSPRIPLRGPNGSPEFWQDYHTACGVEVVQRVQTVSAHSWKWAVDQYKKTAEYKQLSESSKTHREAVLNKFLRRNGNKVGASSITSWKRKHFQTIRNDLTDTPHAWNTLRKYLRLVYAAIIDLDVVEANPLDHVGQLKTNNPDGHHTWTLDEIHQYQEQWPVGTRQRLALELALMTSLRISDVCQIGRQHIKGNWIHFRQTKGSKMHKVPLLTKLQQVIDSTESTGDLTFLVNTYGNRFVVKSLGHAFRRWCDKAGLPHCSMHGLRKAMICYLAEPPMLCSTQEIMAISNHATIKDVETYVAKVRKDLLAEGVRQRLEDQN